MKTLATATLFALLIIGAGCGEQEDAEGTRRRPWVALHTAALQGNVDAIRQHIEAGSDLDQKDAYGSTPLAVAATFGKTEVARALIGGGADLSITNNEGATPLHIAAFLCHEEIVGALLEAGADKGVRDKAGATPLASVAGPFEQVKGVYDRIGKGLAPLGLRLDYERIAATRPRIAAMLR